MLLKNTILFEGLVWVEAVVKHGNQFWVLPYKWVEVTSSYPPGSVENSMKLFCFEQILRMCKRRQNIFVTENAHCAMADMANEKQREVNESGGDHYFVNHLIFIVYCNLVTFTLG